MLRAHKNSQLFRDVTNLRVQRISDEIEAIHNSIDRVEREAASIEKRIRWIRKIVARRLGHRS